MAVLCLCGCVGLSLVAASRGYSLVGGAWTSQCRGFSCCAAWPRGLAGFNSWQLMGSRAQGQ